MKTRPPAPAVTPQELAEAAGRKARRVQRKLHEAEQQMHTANQVLQHVRHAPEVDEAVLRNAEAERKVHEAAEELEVVKEMLHHADGGVAPALSAGQSGDGVKSLLPHLRKH